MGKKYSFKDISLWTIFQEDIKNFIKEDFILASKYNIYRLWDYLQKFGI